MANADKTKKKDSFDFDFGDFGNANKKQEECKRDDVFNFDVACN